MVKGDTEERKRREICLSKMLKSKLGYLVVASQSSVAMLVAHRRTFNFDELPWAREEGAEWRPHLRAQNLKKDQRFEDESNPEGWAPGALRVLTAGATSAALPAQQLAQEQKLASFTQALSRPLDALEFDGVLPPSHSSDATKDLRRLFSMLFSGHLFITHEALAREYAQVVRSLPGLICLDTGNVYCQGQAASSNQSRNAIDWNSPPPSYFLTQELKTLLQEK